MKKNEQRIIKSLQIGEERGRILAQTGYKQSLWYPVGRAGIHFERSGDEYHWQI